MNRKLFKHILILIEMEKQETDFNVFIEQDEDGIYVAKVPELEGCYTQGSTLEEVRERIKEVSREFQGVERSWPVLR